MPGDGPTASGAARSRNAGGVPGTRHLAPPPSPAQLPIQRLPLPAGQGFGDAFVLIPLRIQTPEGRDFTGQFLLDTGLTANMLAPGTARGPLGLPPDAGFEKQGFAAGGPSGGRVVTLGGASLGRQRLRPLNFLVADLPVRGLPGGAAVAGMVGLEVLAQVDVDLDFAGGRARFYRPGGGRAVAEGLGMRAVALERLPAGLLGVAGDFAPVGGGGRPGGRGFRGIVDTGSSFSAVNVEAAAEAGLLPGEGAGAAGGGPAGPSAGPARVLAVGVDGTPTELPLVPADEGVRTGAAGRGERVSFGEGRVAVGDLYVFEGLFGAGARATPLGLVGMDVWDKQRVIFSARDGAVFLGGPYPRGR